MKDYTIPGVKMKEINDINNKNEKIIQKNSLKNTNQIFHYEEQKTEEINKSESINNQDKYRNYDEIGKNLNINNDINIIKNKNKHSPPIKKTHHLNKKKINEKQQSEKKSLNNKDEQNSNKDEKKLSEKDIQRIKKILAYNDKEINDLDFQLALKYDNRKLIELYYSFLKTEHILIKIFNSTDYNSLFIKIFLCFYSFSLSYTVNALFFNDDTIHQILEDEGRFNFLYQLPQIIYSNIISYLFGMILDWLALSEDNILDFKGEKVPQKILQKSKELLRILKYKFIFFFILSFIFLLSFWYYVISFCAVYKNTQYHLIKDSIIGFGTGLLTPLVTKLIPLIFRINGIKNKNKYLFLLSKILQVFF